MELKARLAGAVWGHLIGDALGVPYEFKAASQITTVEWRGQGTHNQPVGTWSDDGALMLALLDSLLRKRAPGEARFDTTDQAKRFLAWRDDRDYTPDHDGMFDIGNATSSAISRFRNGTPAEKSGGTGERDQGNGSLMRILPIALVERDLGDPELVAQAHRSSRVTHGHPVPQAVCALYVLVARNLLRGQARGEAMNNARTALRNVYEHHAKAQLWLGALQTIEGWNARSGRGYVVDSFWSAWDAVAGAKSYQDAVVRAVKYGGDTDTTACIAGGLAGLRWGVEGIPSEWKAGLRGQDIVRPLVAALVGEPRAPAASIAPVAPAHSDAPAGSLTSATHPIRVDWVSPSSVPAAAGWTGELGMTFLPGKKDDGIAGPHWRDLEMDVVGLANEWKADTFVLLVQDRDLKATKVPKELIAKSMATHGIDLVRYPIVDGGVPSDKASFAALLAAIEERLRLGKRVVVACRGGLGRTGTVVGCLLRDAGLSGPAALTLTRDSRRFTIENERQERFILAWNGPSKPRPTQADTTNTENEAMVIDAALVPQEARTSAGVVRDWGDFEHRLITALERMAVDHYLVVEARQAGEDDSIYYVQFAQGGRAGFLAEAVSNNYLQGASQLSPAQEEIMADLGWQFPHPRATKDLNFSREWPMPVPFGDVAHLAIRTLREVFGVESPSTLLYRRFARGGPDFAEPSLGIDAKRPAAPRGKGQPTVPTVADLVPVVESALKAFVGDGPVALDGAGNYPVLIGTNTLNVRILDVTPAAVRVFTPILSGVIATPALMTAINEANTGIAFCRVLFISGEVLVSMEVLGVGITAEDIAHGCLIVDGCAGQVRPRIVEQIGWTPPSSQTQGRPN